MNRHPMMTEQEIDDAIPALINWFESQQINPRDSGRVMIELLAAEYVRKSRDAAELQDAVDLTAWMWQSISPVSCHRRGNEKKLRAVKGGPSTRAGSIQVLLAPWACVSVKSPLYARGTGGLIMFGTMEPWGYGGYGQFHMVIWIILAIAAVVGVVWRLWLLRSGSS